MLSNMKYTTRLAYIAKDICTWGDKEVKQKYIRNDVVIVDPALKARPDELSFFFQPYNCYCTYGMFYMVRFM